MDTVKQRAQNAPVQAKTAIYSSELLDAFKRYEPKIQVLSLDCFDTLLWRRFAAPRDVFYHLDATKINPSMRIRGERLAQQLKLVQEGKTQVTLHEIYRATFPDAAPEEIAELVDAEFAREMEALYAFQPVIDLMRLAIEHKKKIVIVSDIYFTEQQLGKLLESKLPADVFNAIEKIFCSCEYGKAKFEGLFDSVVSHLSVSPTAILHIGDNLVADLHAPQHLGLHAQQLVHYPDAIAEIFRAQTVSAGFVDQRIRNSRGLIHPFQALFAQKNLEEVASLIGYVALGPVMYAFAEFIMSEAARLAASGKKPKILYLLRDAHLPALVVQGLQGELSGARVRISRFSAIASSFCSREDIDNYLAENIATSRFREICKQLLLPKALTEEIIAKVKHSARPQEEFARLIHKNKTLNLIIENATQYRQRLVRYLEKQVNLQKGDTLMFVDLGYSGTTQNKLTAVFKKELDVTIHGCYLLAFQTSLVTATRCGLLDARYYDDSMLSMLVSQIALIEQLCTSMEKSVVDFEENGDPVYSDFSVNEAQHQFINSIQQECVQFALDAKKYFKQHDLHLSESEMRDVAALSLARFLFLPTERELNQLQSMNHDVNLGTKEMIPIVDFGKNLLNLRKRSWLYCLKDKSTNIRMNYAAEWRAASVDLAITLMAQLRNDFELALADISHVREKVSVLLSDGHEYSFDAFPTHLGYFAVVIPVIPAMEMGIRFGAGYQWLELQAIEMIELAHLYKDTETLHTQGADACFASETLVNRGGGLFECTTPDAMLVFTTPKNIISTSHVLRVIFRPVVERG